jgi:hypothetical protein
MFFITTCHSVARSRAVLVGDITNACDFQFRGCQYRRLLLGRELGGHALDEYISTKAVHWNYGENIEWPL